MGVWEDGFAAGFTAGLNAARPPSREEVMTTTKYRRQAAKLDQKAAKKPRKASAANKRYGAAFKRLAPKYKKKGGGWKKDGFKRCAAAARRAAKK